MPIFVASSALALLLAVAALVREVRLRRAAGLARSHPRAQEAVWGRNFSEFFRRYFW